MRCRGWGSVSRGSPHLVVLGREFCSAGEQGVAQPSGVGVSGVGMTLRICWVIALAQPQSMTAAAMEYWTMRAAACTAQCCLWVNAVDASRRASLGVFDPKQEAALRTNVSISIGPRCSRVAAEGETVGRAHNDQRGPLLLQRQQMNEKTMKSRTRL